MNLSEKCAYLKGLMDGLEIDTSTKDGKALVRMSEIISEVVDYVEDMRLQMDSITDWLSDLADMGEDSDEYSEDLDYDDVDELCGADSDSGCLESDVDCSECEGCPVKEETESVEEDTAPVEDEPEASEEEYTEEELSDMLDRYIEEELTAISEADEDDTEETVDDDDDDDTVEEETVSEDDSEPVTEAETETVSETEDEDEELDMEEEEELYEVTCPSCDETVFVSEETLNAGSMKCPNCGELLEFDYDGMTIEDFED